MQNLFFVLLKENYMPYYSHSIQIIQKPLVKISISTILGLMAYFIYKRWTRKKAVEKNIEKNIEQGIKESIEVDIKTQWEAYLKKLETIEREVVRRTKENYSLEKRLPTQLEILKLAEECYKLTEIMYGQGKGDYSAFYMFFYRICEKAQTTFYAYHQLPLKQSNDKFLTLFDLETRSKLQKEYMLTIRKPFIDQGGLWAGGRSAIDNTTLSTIMPKHERDTILAANGLKRFMLMYAQKKVQKMLNKMQKKSPNESLLGNKKIIEDCGQLPPHININARIWLLAEDRFMNMSSAKTSSEKTSHAKTSSAKKSATCDIKIHSENSELNTALFHSFSQFVKSKPGEFITLVELNHHLKSQPESRLQPKHAHWLIQIVGLWQNQLGGISRTSLENLTPIRYFPIQWKRKFALEDFNQVGQRITIRSANSIEFSRIRVNQGGYMPQHGMSLSSGGYVEGLADHHSLLYRMGIPIDPGASLTNMYCDIEKVLTEAYKLNPKTKDGKLLPSQTYLILGQNSICGSSVQQTQHTHIVHGSIKDLPIYHGVSDFKMQTTLELEIEFVPVGKRVDAFYLRIKTTNLMDEKLMKCLLDLRLSLLEKFGANKMDFHFHVIPDGNGQFMIIFAPLIRLGRTQKNDIFIFSNPELHLTDNEFNLPIEGCINLAQGTGTWGIAFSDKEKVANVVKEGKASLTRLWDFTAKKGSREEVMQFLHKHVEKTEHHNKYKF